MSSGCSAVRLLSSLPLTRDRRGRKRRHCPYCGDSSLFSTSTSRMQRIFYFFFKSCSSVYWPPDCALIPKESGCRGNRTNTQTGIVLETNVTLCKGKNKAQTSWDDCDEWHTLSDFEFDFHVGRIYRKVRRHVGLTQDLFVFNLVCKTNFLGLQKLPTAILAIERVTLLLLLLPPPPPAVRVSVQYLRRLCLSLLVFLLAGWTVTQETADSFCSGHGGKHKGLQKSQDVNS